jgi:hypothetical protein
MQWILGTRPPEIEKETRWWELNHDARINAFNHWPMTRTLDDSLTYLTR